MEDTAYWNIFSQACWKLCWFLSVETVLLKLDGAQEPADSPIKMQILIQSGMEPEILFL